MTKKQDDGRRVRIIPTNYNQQTSRYPLGRFHRDWGRFGRDSRGNRSRTYVKSEKTICVYDIRIYIHDGHR